VLTRDKNYAKKFSGFVFVDTVYNHGNGVVLLYILPGDSANSGCEATDQRVSDRRQISCDSLL